MVSIIKKNIKLIIFIILVGVLSFGSVYAATLFRASDITFTPPSGSSENNVQTALDYLYSKASNLGSSGAKDNNVTFEFLVYGDSSNTDNTISSNYTDMPYKAFLANNGSVESVCYYHNNSLNCFDYMNYEIEYMHLLSLFKDAPFITTTGRNGYTYTYDKEIDLSKDYCLFTPVGLNANTSDELYCWLHVDGSYDDMGIYIQLFAEGSVEVGDEDGVHCAVFDDGSSHLRGCSFPP